MPKKILSLILVLTLAMALAPAALAESGTLLVDGVAVPMETLGSEYTLRPNETQLGAIIRAHSKHTALFDLSGYTALTAATLTLTPSWVTQSDASVCVVTPFGMVEVYSDNLAMLSGLPGETSITLRKSADGGLTLSVTQGGAPVSLCDYTMPISVGVPYKAESGQSTDLAVLAKRSGAGLTYIPRSFYINGYIYAWVYAPGTFQAATAQQNGFKDTPGKWMDKAVGYMAARDIVRGTAVGTFTPDSSITRGEFITMLMRMLGIEADTTGTSQFADVRDGSFYFDHALLARALGIVTPTSGNLFDPETPIIRQDMFVMAYNALTACGMLQKASADLTGFGDSALVSGYAQDAMQTLYKHELIAGGDGLLMPTGTTTRAQAAQFLYNILAREGAK